MNVLLSPVMGPIGKNSAGGRNWEGVKFELIKSLWNEFTKFLQALDRTLSFKPSRPLKPFEAFRTLVSSPLVVEVLYFD